MPAARPVGGVADAVGPEQWFRSLPLVTQYWFTAALVVTVAGNFSIISPGQLLFSWHMIKDKFELWRLLTPFCYLGGFSFDMLISLYMLVQFSNQYETGGPFNTGAGGGTADYAFMMMFGAAAILVTYPVVSAAILPLPPIFSRNLIYYVLYVWSKRNPEQQANIWGIPIQAVYLPFAYLALTVLMGNPYNAMLHGLAIGHLYYFLADVVPKVQGRDVLHTPQFLIDQLGIGEYRPEPEPRPVQERPRTGGIQNLNNAAAPPSGGGAGGARAHDWGGGGRALGTD